MRRTRVILASLASALVVGPGVVGPQRASAHFCSTPVEINVGESVVVNIGVAAEQKPVRGVDISIPEGFDLEEPFGYLGYVGTVDGDWVHFEGAEIAPFTCTFFSFQGQATRRGRLVARIVTTAVDGAKTQYNDLKPASLYPAQLIYAGVPVPTGAQPESKSGFPSIWLGLAGALTAGGIAVGAAVLVNRRRAMTR